jgi:hypothetical protein
MPPHLKILSDLRKSKRKKNNARRTGSNSAAVAAAAGSPPVKGKGRNGPAGPLTRRVDKLGAIIASPPHRKPSGPRQRPQTQPSKGATRTRGK